MFGTWIGWIVKTFDYINRANITLPLSVYEGTWTHSPPLIAMHLLDRSCVSVGIFLKLHATFPNGTVTDAPPNTLRACIIFSMWLRQTVRMVLCIVHVLSVGIRRITLPQKPFTSTYLRRVSCHTIMFGPSMEKEGL